MQATRLIVIRHGESKWNREGRQQGHLDSGLTETGIAQVRAIAERLRKQSFTALYSSDLGRAYQTAEIIASQTGHRVVTDERLRERNLGIFQGHTWDEIERKYPEELHSYRTSGPGYVIPQGESVRQRVQRTVGCLEELATRHRGESIVVVAHSGVLNGLLRRTLGIPLEQRRRFKLWNASLNVFLYEDGTWTLGTWGDVAHADPFPISKSFLSEVGLARTIEAEYGLKDVRCQLITASLRDVYLVISDRRRHVLHIYRHGQRTVPEIVSEWQFVDYLDTNGVPVAPAIRRQSGELLLTFDAPEGTRHGVMSRFIAGEHLRRRPSIEAVAEYGRIVAKIHTLADSMPFELDRPANDADSLLDGAIAAFESEVPQRPEDLAYLHESADILRSRIDTLPKSEPYYGMIHGDVIRANAQVADDGSVTVLDFDLCGPGWRAYDIASYLIVMRGLPEEEESERAFLGGYQGIRRITDVEWEALPTLEAVRAIFGMGVQAMNVYHWGSAYLHAFWNHSLERLKRVMERVEP